LHHGGYVSAALFSPDGRFIFTGAFDATARLWELPPPPTAPTDVANSKASSGTRFLARRDHKEGAFSPITVFNMADGSEFGRTAPGQCAGITEDGLVLLYAEGNRFELLQLSGTAPAKMLSHFKFPYSQAKSDLREAEISPDGRYALISPDRCRIHLFDLSKVEAKENAVIQLDTRFIWLRFSADGEMVAVNTARPEREQGSVVSLWRLADGKQITSFTTGQRVSHLEFSPDSRLIAWGGVVGYLRGAAARIHHCADGKPSTPYLAHRGDILDLEFSPNSRVLATGGTDGIARLWDTSTGALVAPELPHPNHVENLGFSLNGRRLVSLVTKGTPAMRVWDTVSGEAMTPPLRLSKGAWICRFTDDGTALITAGTTFIRWPLTDDDRTPADLIAEAELLSVHRHDPVAGRIPLRQKALAALWEQEKARRAEKKAN
jgi:WD40 repeat protein